MSRFEPIKFAWAGIEYTIPAESVMRAIAIIEDHVTFAELLAASKKRTIPAAKLSNAFAALVQFAGGVVSAEEVYAGMFVAGDTQQSTFTAIIGLMSMMIPPEHVQKTLATGNPPAPAGKHGSSKTRGKRR